MKETIYLFLKQIYDNVANNWYMDNRGPHNFGSY
jgi:hypothetical protein